MPSDGITRTENATMPLPFAGLYEKEVRRKVDNPVGHGYLTRPAGEPEPNSEDVYQGLLAVFQNR